MRRRGENEMRCEGKKAGGRVCSGSSGAVGDRWDVEIVWLLVVKSSLSEKSAPCQGSLGTGVSAGAETVRGIDAVFGGVGGGNRDEMEGADAEGCSRDEQDATGGGVTGGGRQNEPADDDGVIAQDVASLKGEFGSDGYGDADPHDDGDDGHSPMSPRSAHGSNVLGRARAAAATSARLKGLVKGVAAGWGGMGASRGKSAGDGAGNMVALGDGEASREGERVRGASQSRRNVEADGGE